MENTQLSLQQLTDGEIFISLMRCPIALSAWEQRFVKNVTTRMPTLTPRQRAAAFRIIERYPVVETAADIMVPQEPLRFPAELEALATQIDQLIEDVYSGQSHVYADGSVSQKGVVTHLRVLQSEQQRVIKSYLKGSHTHV